MKIYRLQESGSRSMGFTTFEKYFQHESDAKKAFDEKIKEYRKSKDLVKRSDLDGQKPIRIDDNPRRFGIKKNVVKEAFIAVWDEFHIPEEGTEYDIGSLHLEIIEIEVA
ncbi:hypothetical protein [Paenibacillus lautus]|uniref:hypothetical protein n=1 Tax=Paenibacillus lautus TaxID=1401 RepID=UPI00398875BD